MSATLHPPMGRATWSKPPSRWGLRALGTGLDRKVWLPLAVTMAVFALGALYVVVAKTASVGAVERGLRQRTITNLNAVRAAAELETALKGILTEPAERRHVAQEIFDRLPGASGRRPLDDVDALAAMRVPAETVARRSDLGSLRDRGRALVASNDPRARARGVPLLSGSQFRELRPNLIVRQPAAFHGAFFGRALLFLLAFAAMHVLVHARGRRGDRFLLPAAQALSGLGFLMLVSLRDPVRDAMQFTTCTQGVLMGGLAFVLASLPRYERTDLRRLAFIPLVVALAISVALVLFGQGPQGSGAKVNLLGAQPIELIRLLLVLFLAGYFARRWVLLRELDEKPLGDSWLLRRLRIPRLHHILPVTIGVAASILFSIGQRDLGPALLLVTLFLLLYAVSRGGAVLATAGFLAVAGAFYLSHLTGFPDTVRLRTGMWLSPWDNGLERGVQLAQSLWAFSAGGLSGMGLGLGSPEYVPAVHTDLILSAIGEELGFIGVLSCLALYGLIAVRGFRISRAGADDYTMFLALGLTLNIALEALLIAGGATGLVPLTGVVMPFMSFGRSAQVLHLAGLGMLWALSASAASARSPVPAQPSLHIAFDRPRALVLGGLGLMLMGIALKAAEVQLFRADRVFATETLELQGDGELRYQPNPRLKLIAAGIPRGDILDRNGVVLATSDWRHLEKARPDLARFGIDPEVACARGDERHYPFGGLTYHLLGDVVSQRNWGASNTAFVERRYDDDLCGYDDRARVVTLRDPRSGETKRVLSRDRSELVPLWRHRYQPNHRSVKALLARQRDLRLTIDIQLQSRAARLLRDHVTAAGLERGALVALDPETGGLLASVSHPAPRGPIKGDERLLDAAAEASLPPAHTALMDRARYGVYPPGSTFKLVTAAAALSEDPALARTRFACRRLSDGVGTVVHGRLVHDDTAERPHGTLAMEDATALSCNAYYAQLGSRVGWQSLSSMATRFGISSGDPGDPGAEDAFAIESAYGQAQVTATPLEMARVAAVIAAGGTMAAVHWVTGAAEPDSGAKQLLNPLTAATLGRYMRQAVTRGTARRIAGVTPAVAGKTGTAQIAEGRPHAWFIGYAPYGRATRRIAFAVMLENGGSGGGRATELGGQLAAEALRLGYAE